MTGKHDPITTDSMAAEIEQAEIVWDKQEKWVRPLAWPDYSQLDISTNILNNQQVTAGVINQSGAITNPGGWYYTNYIPVDENTSYIASSISKGGSGTYFALYDASKTLTRTVLIVANENPTFTTAANERFVRFSLRNFSNEMATAQLQKGTVATPYVPYFEGMYFTFDTSRADGRTEWASFYCACAGGYKVERGQLVNGVFTAEQTSNVGNGGTFFEWLPSTITGYVVYRITAQTPGSPITSIGIRTLPTAQTGDGRYIDFYYQRVLERFGRLPNLTSFSNWGNVHTKSDTIYDLKSLTTLYLAWTYSYSIENIDITGYNSRVTSCQSTFSGCKQLRYINNTDKLVTSACTVMYYMFCTCYNLLYVDSSTWDTSNVTNMRSAFDSCYSLYILDTSGWNTSKVTTFYATFAGCYKLKHLDVSGFNTSNATEMYYMFGACHRLEELDVSNFDTSKVSGSMAYMFSNMFRIKSLDLSSFDTSKVTSMAYMFVGDRALEYVNLSSFDTSKVTTVQQMFYNCGGLKNLDLSNFDYTSCTNFADFLDLTSHTQDDFKLDFSTCNATVTTINYMFQNNTCLTGMVDLSAMTISQTNPSSVFRSCYNIEIIKLPASLTSIGTYCFDYCRCLKKLVIPSTTLVTLANTNAFTNRNGCPLTIYVPDNLVSSYQAADNWKSLHYVTFAGLSTYTE